MPSGELSTAADVFAMLSEGVAFLVRGAAASKLWPLSSLEREVLQRAAVAGGDERKAACHAIQHVHSQMQRHARDVTQVDHVDALKVPPRSVALPP